MNKKYYFFCLTIFFCSALAFAQQDPIDSLKLALKNAKHDTIRCNILNELAETASDEEWPVYNEQLLKLAQKCASTAPSTNLKEFYSRQLAGALNNIGVLADEQGEITKALEFYQKSLKIQEEIKDKKGIASSLNNIGLIYKNQGDIPKALGFYHKSLKIQEEIIDKVGIATSLNNIGSIYENQGDIPKALEFFHKSLKIHEEIMNKKGIAYSLINIGFIYQNQGDIPKALEYFYKSLKIQEEIMDKSGIAYSLNNIGTVYKNQGDPLCNSYKEDCLRAGQVKALEFYRKSLKILEEIMDKAGIATSLINIGFIYQDQGDISKALEFYHKSLKIREEIMDKEEIANSLNNIGGVFFRQGKYPEAIVYAKRSMATAQELGFPRNIKDAASLLKNIYRKQNKFKEAFDMYELEIQMRDSISNQETRKASLKKQFQYTYEKKEAVVNAEHKIELEKQQAVANEKSRKQKIVIWSVAIGLLLVIVFAAFVFKSLNTTRKQKQLIEIKNIETEEQKKIIEEKQKDILDSIHYAKRIQTSLLPTERYIAKVLKDNRKKV